MTFLRAEDQSVVPGDLHQPMEIQIVLLGVFAVDDDVIRNADGARALSRGIIHGLPEGVLGHVQAKKESENSRPSDWALESCQFRRHQLDRIDRYPCFSSNLLNIAEHSDGWLSLPQLVSCLAFSL